MALERAHPHHPGFMPGTKCYKNMVDRYSFCNQFIRNKKVLDVPVGTGFGASFLGGYSELHGFEIDNEAVEFCRKAYPWIKVAKGDMVDGLFNTYGIDAFDVVLCLEGYEHISEHRQKQFLHTLYLVCESNGLIIMTVPVHNPARAEKNKYHLHEPTVKEFEEAVETYFDTDQLDIIKSPDGNELIRYVGRNRP